MNEIITWIDFFGGFAFFIWAFFSIAEIVYNHFSKKGVINMNMTGFGTSLLQIALIVMKLAQIGLVASWSWWLVMLPTIILIAFIFVLLISLIGIKVYELKRRR